MELQIHIVFAPKFRRQIIYGRLKTEIGKILRTLCERKEIEIIEANLCADHVHMLIANNRPNIVCRRLWDTLKGKSSLMIFDRFAHMKYKYGNRHFWCRGYYVDTVGRNQKKKIAEYIRNQLKEDYQADQLSLFEPVDRLRVNRSTQAKKIPVSSFRSARESGAVGGTFKLV